MNNQKEKQVEQKTLDQNNIIIYKMYNKLTRFEQHFDLITSIYRYLALTWTMVCYAAVIFLLSSSFASSIPKLLIYITFVCAVGIIGLSVIWNLDLNIYTKFWSVMFIEEIRLEKKFNFLLPSRNIELLVDQGRRRIVDQSFIYIITNSVLYFLFTVSLFSLNANWSNGYNLIIILCFIFMLLASAICYSIYRTAEKTEKILAGAIADIMNIKGLPHK
ncbi:MAG: hypothetical protein K2X39_04265 [Silvanigrellaceae bacterium]|nr:hypothetical protein [Silvanigrellaceae bacterium]